MAGEQAYRLAIRRLLDIFPSRRPSIRWRGSGGPRCACWEQQRSVVANFALEILHQVTKDINKLKRVLFLSVSIAAWNYLDCPAGDKLQQDIRKWLSPPDPWKNYNIARKSQHRGTRAWFLQSPALADWKSSGPSSLLWLHGKRQLLFDVYSFVEVA
jgi:hypothetical protein